MELKLANDEDNNKKTGGLSLSGEERGDSKVQENPWDFDKPPEPIVTRSVRSSVTADSSLHTSAASDVHIVVKIGGIIVYVCVLLIIVSIVWTVTQPKIEIYTNMQKISPLFSLCGFFLIVDAILVNVLYERKISLIIWAWLLMIVYPMKREKHVNGGSSWGGLACLGMIMAFAALCANIMTAVTTYGQAVMNADETIRKEIATFMEQPVADGGGNFEAKLKRNFAIQNIDVVTEGNQMVVVVQGNGQYGADKDNFIDYTNKMVPSQLAFVKDASGNYQIGAVQLGDVTLSNHYMNYYWNTFLK